MRRHFHFIGTPEEIQTRVRWCRSNFGARGIGWDFTGGLKRLDIVIYDPKLTTMYIMWFGEGELSY